MEENLIRKKAELILGGAVKIPEGFQFPFRTSHSTAGPGAGYESAVFAFGDLRVKKAISYDSGDFELIPHENRYSLSKNGELFLDNVRLIPVVFHCPEQAFFNLDQRCIYNCAYCASPMLDKSTFKGITDQYIVEGVGKAVSEKKIVSVSLTSGVVGSVDETVSRFVSCIKSIREKFPDIPIGVEPYISEKKHIMMLKEAGANEIKLNLESSDKNVFQKVCPELDYDSIWDMLSFAVDVFGKGMVSSNIIFGMGETDENIRTCFDKLSSMGVVPTARAIRWNTMNRNNLEKAIGKQPYVTPERMIRIAEMQMDSLKKHGLDTRHLHTMCVECTCCDIVPFRDIV